MRRLIASAVLSLSLIGSSTAATASAPPPAAASNAWVALSMLTPSGAVGLEGTAATAAQPDAVPRPPPPPPEAGFTTPPIPVIAVWLAVIAVDIWILTRNHHHHFPNSPA